MRITTKVGAYSVLFADFGVTSAFFGGALQASSGCGHPLSLTSGTHHRKHFLSTQRFAFTSPATIQANAEPSLPLHEPRINRRVHQPQIPPRPTHSLLLGTLVLLHALLKPLRYLNLGDVLAITTESPLGVIQFVVLVAMIQRDLGIQVV